MNDVFNASISGLKFLYSANSIILAAIFTTLFNDNISSHIGGISEKMLLSSFLFSGLSILLAGISIIKVNYNLELIPVVLIRIINLKSDLSLEVESEKLEKVTKEIGIAINKILSKLKTITRLKACTLYAFYMGVIFCVIPFAFVIIKK